MVTQFKDHFSGCADAYRLARPTYPVAMFEWLAGEAPRRRLAWDCATGSGQAARSLASFFDVVVATDASVAQIDHAVAHPRVAYRTAAAESAPFADHSVDLLTVAQAVHWFDTGRFFIEACRVLHPGGVVALWSYGLARSDDPEIDALIDHLYRDILGPYWPPERQIVEQGLADLEWPFTDIVRPPFTMQANWTPGELIAYLGTWSAVGRYRERCGQDPLAAFAAECSRTWSEPFARHPLTWPLSLRVGRA